MVLSLGCLGKGSVTKACRPFAEDYSTSELAVILHDQTVQGRGRLWTECSGSSAFPQYPLLLAAILHMRQVLRSEVEVSWRFLRDLGIWSLSLPGLGNSSEAQ